MAQVITVPPKFGKKLRDVLERGLRERQIDATVETERVRNTALYRALVVTPQFEHMYHSERQDIIWRIITEAMSTEELLHISTILALTPDDIGTD
jgi:acid stress-induced BolA-like protein IbaG/YrbA